MAQIARMAERPRNGFILVLLLGLSLPSCSTITDIGGDDVGSTGAATSSTSNPGSTTLPEPEPTTTSAVDTSSSSGEADCNFLGCDPDVPQVETCNVWDDDCPRGEKCNIWANDGGSQWNATRCVPLAPDPAGAGEPCTAEGSGVSGFDDCDVASVCLVADSETLEGECMPMCTGSENAPVCEDPHRVCTIWGDSTPAFCRGQCDPLDLESCPDGQACYPVDTGAVCAPDASGPDLGAAFDQCEFTNACNPGLVCLGATVVGVCPEDAARCCTPWCDLTEPVCPEPTTCIPAYDPGSAPPGQEDVGVCGQENAR